MILISPWSRLTTDEKPSPKNYPYWDQVVEKLPKPVIQISCSKELEVKHCADRYNDLPLNKIEQLIKECETWISVDNFFHHLAWSIGKRGVVIFGSSDPNIFGHPQNINLLKSRKNLRDRQFGLWSQTTYNPDIFISPEEVVKVVRMLVHKWQD